MSDLFQPWHIVVLLLYFAPSFVAWRRKVKATAGVVIVDVFLGWTFVGWVAALVWASIGELRPKPSPAAPLATE
jgi:hypothetical protein